MSAAECDLLLIQPPAYGEFSPPLGLATLTGYLRANGMNVKSLDYNIDFFHYVPKELRKAWKFSEALSAWNDRKIYASEIQPHFKKFAKNIVRDLMIHNPKYVGISILETGAQTSYDLIRAIREFMGKDVKIIVGGPHIGKEEAADFILNHGAYCAFRGEAEIGLLNLLKQTREELGPRLRDISGVCFLEDGEIVETKPKAVHDINTLPFPDFSDFKLESYAFKEKLLPITTSRGCIAKCSFCGETNFMDSFRQMSAQRIVEEIRNGIKNYGVKTFRLNDSLINGNPKVLEGWIDELLVSDVKIIFGAAQARISDRMTLPLLEKLKKAGCYLIQYGLETGSDRLLKIMRKGINGKLALDVLRRTRDSGMAVQINIIVGHPQETFKDFFQTLLLVIRARKYLDVIAPNPYNFDKFSEDTAKAKGITNLMSERWSGIGWQNTYPVRMAKMRALLILMKILRIRRT